MKNRLKSLQNYLKKNNLDAFIIPREDEHLNEYPPLYSERLKWITNFSGSSGIAIILRDKASIFTDGRYLIQINEEVDKKLFFTGDISYLGKWIIENLGYKFIVAIDPKLFSIRRFENIKEKLNQKKIKIHFVKDNPIDLLWKNRSYKPLSKVFLHNLKFTGKNSLEKIKEAQKILLNKKCKYFILTSLDSIAWLLNLRGSDIKYTPVNLAYVIIPSMGKISLYIESKKLNKLIFKKLSLFINVYNYNEIEKNIAKIKESSVIGLDENKICYWFKKKLKDKKILIKKINESLLIPKAKKNYIELQGAKNANIRDGVSLTKFLYWLKNNANINNIDEILAARKLYELRKKNKNFFSLSFDTISAYGSNSALPHYRVNNKTNSKFFKNNIYLIDSGAQYLDGTTDITRTIILGRPKYEHMDKFTRVLKGHIALARSMFNKRTRGSDIDFLARQYLRKIDCDYNHGTGHGIGSFLSVHEGPQRISKPLSVRDSFLESGMILSNEPGYYEVGKYGIRIENLIIVKEVEEKKLEFETISWAPIDRDLMLMSLITNSEKKWINEYHNDVYNNLSKYLLLKEKNWLKKVTKSI